MLAILVPEMMIATSVWGAAPVPSIRRAARMILRGLPVVLVLPRPGRLLVRRPQGRRRLCTRCGEPAELLEDAGLVPLHPLLTDLAVADSKERLRLPAHRLA